MNYVLHLLFIKNSHTYYTCVIKSIIHLTIYKRIFYAKSTFLPQQPLSIQQQHHCFCDEIVFQIHLVIVAEGNWWKTKVKQHTITLEIWFKLNYENTMEWNKREKQNNKITKERTKPNEKGCFNLTNNKAWVENDMAQSWGSNLLNNTLARKLETLFRDGINNFCWTNQKQQPNHQIKYLTPHHKMQSRCI
jgi:hypothetical protein